MNALVRDPRVVRAFDTWGQQTGLYDAADAVARAAAQIAAAAKVSHWTPLVDAEDVPDEVSSSSECSLLR